MTSEQDSAVSTVPPRRNALPPVASRVAALAAVAVDVLLDIRSFVNASLPGDRLLSLLPWVLDAVVLLIIILSLRGVDFIGFKRRSRPRLLKVVMAVAAAAWVLVVVSPHFSQKGALSTQSGHYYTQAGDATSRTEISADAYWSRQHSQDRFTLAANLLVLLVLLGAAEARLGDPPAARVEDAEAIEPAV